MLILAALFIISACDSKSMPLDSNIWGDWDAGLYADERYNMTLWLFKENWFEGKTKEDVIQDLPNRTNSKLYEIKEDSIFYSVKFTNGFMERWNIDYIQQDLGILIIHFENDTIVKSEYKERKDVESEYIIKKVWTK